PFLCQQTSDKRKTLIASLSYSRQHASIRWRYEGMEHACTEANLVRVRAADRRGEGLQPSKVRGTSTLRFTKGGSEKLQVITWDEFERTASGRDLAVYESGGWMKLMRRH